MRSPRGPSSERVADVLERHDVVGDDPGVDVRDLVLAPQEEAVHLDRPPLASARPARRSGSCRAGSWSSRRSRRGSGSSHHWWSVTSITATGIPSRNPKMNPKLTISRSSRLPMSRKIRTTRSGFCLEVVDHHQLRVEQLVDVNADLVGDLADDLRQLLLDALVDRVLHPGRQVLPGPRVLAGHDAIDDVRDLAARTSSRCARRSGRARAAGRTRPASRASRSPCPRRCSPSSRRVPGRCPASPRRPA